MINFKSFGIQTTLAAAALSAATIAVAPAQAITLSGSLGLSGQTIINSGTVPTQGLNSITLDFQAGAVNSTSGSFSTLVGPTFNVPGFVGVFDPQTLVLTDTTVADPLQDVYSASQQNISLAFIDFGTQTLDGFTSNLSFYLDQPLSFDVNFANANQVSFNSNIFTGYFKFGNDTIAQGFMNASISSNGSGNSSTYQITIATKAVPEPATLMGLGLVGAAIAGTRRKSTKS